MTQGIKSKAIRLLIPTEIPDRRWEDVAMYFVIAIPKTKEGYDEMMVIVDKLSKQLVFSPTTTTVTAEGAAKLYAREIYRHHGIPRKIFLTAMYGLRQNFGQSCTVYRT